MKQLEDAKSEQLIIEVAKFIASSPPNITSLHMSFLDNMDDISGANLLELFTSFAVNKVLREVEITTYNFCACKEKVLALLLENNFSLKKIWVYDLDIEELYTFEAFAERNKYVRKQRRFKTVKPVSGSGMPYSS